jgi:hypothetical protein
MKPRTLASIVLFAGTGALLHAQPMRETPQRWHIIQELRTEHSAIAVTALNDASRTYRLSVNEPISGDPNGARWQPSHWQDRAINGSRIGLMDPEADKGFTADIPIAPLTYWTLADTRALDILGWNLNGTTLRLPQRSLPCCFRCNSSCRLPLTLFCNGRRISMGQQTPGTSLSGRAKRPRPEAKSLARLI